MESRENTMRLVSKFMSDESGASAAEYALLLALIAVVIIAGAQALGVNISNVLSFVATDV
jgi:pilus assembly protein Flp/PilA